MAVKANKQQQIPMAFFNPFCSQEAIDNSNYCSMQSGRYRLGQSAKNEMKDSTRQVAAGFSTILNLLKKVQVTVAPKDKQLHYFGVYGQLGSTEATAGLCRDLARFIYEQQKQAANSNFFLAVFTSLQHKAQTDLKEQARQQIKLLETAAEPFYCLSAHEEQALRKQESIIGFGGRLLRTSILCSTDNANKIGSTANNSASSSPLYLLIFSLQPAPKKEQPIAKQPDRQPAGRVASDISAPRISTQL